MRPVLLHTSGCDEGCCAVNDEGFAAMAREQGLFLYSAEDPGPCYWVDTPKTYLHWHGNYVIMVTDQSVVQRLSIYDVRNKITAFTKNFRTPKKARKSITSIPGGKDVASSHSSFGTTSSTTSTAAEDAILLRSDGEVRFVLHEWGQLFVVTSTHRIYSLCEKDTRTKVEELERKHLYHVALSLAVNDMEHDVDSIFEICKNYGDHLYHIENYDEAVKQYINCGVHVEPSHVIRKFLEANRLNNLTEYLEALHRRNMQATTDHTTLLLTCYTQQRNVERLRAFIGYKDENIENIETIEKTQDKDDDAIVKESNTVPSNSNGASSIPTNKQHTFDVPTAIRVLHRRNFTDEASFLAKKHHKHDQFIHIQLENLNPQRARAALVYISGLSFLDAEAALKTNGKTLLQYLPEETTEILKSICTPSSHNTKRNGTLESKSSASISKIEIKKSEPVMLVSDPEEFIATFVDHPLHLKRFLWHIIGSRKMEKTNLRNANSRNVSKTASKLVWNTLLELCLNSDLALQELREQEMRRQLNNQAKKEEELTEDTKDNQEDPLLQEILGMVPSTSSTTSTSSTAGGVTATKTTPATTTTTIDLRAAADTLVEDEVMEILKDASARYDGDHALVLVQQYHFEPGMMYLYEKKKMYHMLVQRHMDSGNHQAILMTCRKYGQRDPNLWVQVLTYLTNSYGTVTTSRSSKRGNNASVNSPQQCARHIQQVLQLGSAYLPPLLVLSILSKNRSLPVSIVHEYLVKHLRAEQQEIRDDTADIIEKRVRIDQIRSKMHTLATSAQVFQHSTDQLIPDQPLSLPVIHFMSGNSYNLENVDITDVQLQAGVPNATRRVDPNMAEEHHRLMHMLTDLQHKSQKHEDFYREMQAAGSVSGFDKVSEYFGLGVFDQPRNRKSSGTPLRGSNRGTNR